MTRRSWLWPLSLFLICIAVGVAVMSGLGVEQDRAAIREFAFRAGSDSAALIDTTQWITWAGDAAQRWIVVVGFAGWLWLVRKQPRAALVLIVVAALAGVASSLLKEAFFRPRPDVVPHLDHAGSQSFPSGHASNAMTILLLGALLLARRARGLWIALAIVAATVMGVTRTLLGVHYPSDLLGGWLLGAAFALIGWRLASPPAVSDPMPVAPPAIFPAQSHSLQPRSDELHPSAATSDFPPTRA